MQPDEEQHTLDASGVTTTVRRSGGFAGVDESFGPVALFSLPRGISTFLLTDFWELPSDFPSPQIVYDAFSFTVSVTRGGRDHSVTWTAESHEPHELFDTFQAVESLARDHALSAGGSDMEITVRRTGGFAGVDRQSGPLPTSALHDHLSSYLAGSYWDLPHDLPAGGLVGRLFTFTVTVNDRARNRSHSVRFVSDSNVPDPLTEIIEYVEREVGNRARWASTPIPPPPPLR